MEKRNLKTEWWINRNGRADRPDILPLAPLLPPRRKPWHWTLGWMVILVAFVIGAGLWH